MRTLKIARNAFKPFHGKKSLLGNALIIDCIPVLETLGPDFQESVIEFGSSREMFAMLDMKELFDEPQQAQGEKAWYELQESFYFKLLKTFQELPQCPPPTALSKKLIEIPVRVIFTSEETPITEETLKLPRGAVTLSRVDCKFLPSWRRAVQNLGKKSYVRGCATAVEHVLLILSLLP